MNGSTAPYEITKQGTNLGKKNAFLHTDYGSFRDRVCWHPRGHGSYAVAYFHVFAIFGGFILTSLFIGSICGGIQDALQEFAESEDRRRIRREAKTASMIGAK